MRPFLALPLVLALACAGPQAPTSPAPPVLRDPMVVAVDGSSPGNGFDGSGSLFLGEGWGRPEGSGDDKDWGAMAWVIGREAAVHLFLPPDPRMDFFARCLPYPWAAGSPEQEMELVLGRRVLGRVKLVGDWQDVRIPLPDGLPKGKILDLRLRFAHALKPRDFDGGEDGRSLAAAFTLAAVVPRAVADPKPFLAAYSFAPETGRVVLPAGGGLRLPLPPASRVRLRLQDVRTHCQGCRLSLELSAPRGISSLWLRATPQGPGTLEFLLAPDSLQVQRSAGRAAGEGNPNVFLYVIDTLRADVLASHGARPELTPRMNAFAGEAVTYMDARAPSSWTLPSVVSLLTGLYPDRHGVMEGKLQFDPERLPSLQRLLGERGYRTVGISQSFIVSSAYGLNAGFGGFYLDDQLNGLQLRSQEARSLLAGWLGQQDGGSPLFAYLHTVDPHSPYSPPPLFRESLRTRTTQPPQEEGLPQSVEARGKIKDAAEIAHLRALYDAEARYADQELGRFLDLLRWLGLYDHSFVILASDHGEEFAEHGGLEHGKTLFEEALRVPLIVKYPGGRWAGQRIGGAVSLVDVAPTVLASLLPPLKADLDGTPLPGPETARRRDRPAYFEIAPAWEPESSVPRIDLRGMVSGGVKCIEDRAASRLQAFALAADPAERRALPPQAAELERCRRLLEGWSRSRERQVREQRSRRRASPEAMERLKALGYVN
jgi:arylsulfatase A-like enzyme